MDRNDRTPCENGFKASGLQCESGAHVTEISARVSTRKHF